MAVAAPALLQSLENPAELQALLQLPMIHIDWGRDNRYLPDWSQWLTAAGLGHCTPAQGPHFNLSSMAIDAAVQGRGLLLGQQLLIENELASGQLVAVDKIRLPLEKSYFLVYPQGKRENKNVADFIDWISDLAESH